jgi:TRAP-type C4-dicarboxylate transport system permease small subunit
MPKSSAPVALTEVIALWRGRLIALVAWFAFSAFSVIFAINIAQIFVRIFGGGWIWVHDVSALLFAWTVMLGAAAAYGKFDHVVASVLVDRISLRWSRILAILVRLIEVSVGAIILYASLEIVETRMSIPYVQLGIPTGWAYVSVSVLGAAILIFGLTTPFTPRPREEFPADDQTSESNSPLTGKEDS